MVLPRSFKDTAVQFRIFIKPGLEKQRDELGQKAKTFLEASDLESVADG
jgi:hypothetical protein